MVDYTQREPHEETGPWRNAWLCGKQTKEAGDVLPVPRMLHIGTQHIQKDSVHSFHQAISHEVVGCCARLSYLESLAEICKNLTFKVTALI